MLDVDGLGKSFGSKQVLKAGSFKVRAEGKVRIQLFEELEEEKNVAGV